MNGEDFVMWREVFSVHREVVRFQGWLVGVDGDGQGNVPGFLFFTSTILFFYVPQWEGTSS